MMITYPVTLTRDSNGTLLVDVVDLPEAHAVGDDEAEALRNAVEAIETALEMHAERQVTAPAPAPPQPGQPTVEVHAPDRPGSPQNGKDEHG